MHWIDILVGLSSGTVTSGGIGALVVKVLKRVAGDIVRTELQPISNKIQGIEIKLASETGGNSNGLRQAVNQLQKDVTEVRIDVASLKGALNGKPVAAAVVAAS